MEVYLNGRVAHASVTIYTDRERAYVDRSRSCVGMNILDELSGPGFVERVHELHIDVCTM